MSGLFEIVILAAVAGFVLMQLFRTLGRTDGDEPDRPRPYQPGPIKVDQARNGDRDDADRPLPLADSFPGENRIRDAYPAFTRSGFLDGARSAYVAIVTAFDAHDRDTLADLVTPDVLEAWSGALTEPAIERDAELPVRVRKAEIVSGGAMGRSAYVKVAFDAVIGEGAEEREARDLWTFTRDVRDPNPNWFLSSVESGEG